MCYFQASSSVPISQLGSFPTFCAAESIIAFIDQGRVSHFLTSSQGHHAQSLLNELHVYGRRRDKLLPFIAVKISSSDNILHAESSTVYEKVGDF